MKRAIHLLKNINLFFRFGSLSVLILLLLSFISISKLQSVSGKDEPKKGIKTVVIDAGHGGKDPGCNGVKFKEKDVSLAIALKLGKLIEENCKDVKVIYTRKTDIFVELEERAEIANKNKADLFISIHCNAAGKPVMVVDKKTGKKRPKTFKNSKGKMVVVETTNPEPFGSETYVMGLKNEQGKMKVAQRENSVILMEDNYQTKYQGFDPDSEESYIIMSNYTSAYVIQSASLALKIQEEYSKKAGRIDKGVHRQSIWVLWRTAMPSILTEVGYLTNPIEEKFLGSENGQTYMASAIFRAFRKYKDEIEGNKKSYNDALENQTPLVNENTPEAQDSLRKSINAPDDSDKDDDKATHDDDSIKDNKNEEIKSDEISEKKDQAIDKVSEKQKEQEKKYNDYIKIADEQFKAKKYEDAKHTYEEALAYKKDVDTYPDKKIEDIKSILEKQRIAKEQEEKEREQKEVTSQDIIKNYKDKNKKDTTNETPTKDKPVENNKSGIVFMVQFATQDKEIDAKTKYPNVDDVSFYKMGAAYKYTSGHYAKMDDAVNQQTKLRGLGYKDCFVIAMKDGKRMDVNEAKKILAGQ